MQTLGLLCLGIAGSTLAWYAARADHAVGWVLGGVLWVGAALVLMWRLCDWRDGG